MEAHSALLKESNSGNNYNTNLISNTTIKTPNTKSIDNQNEVNEQQKQSVYEEIIGSRFNSIFSEMDVDDPLNIDLKEGEWLKCCNGSLKLSLTVATIAGALLGAVIGIAISLNTTLPDGWYKIILLPGQIWVRALKLLVLPLISLMMVVLPSRVDDVGSVAKQCVPLYIFTSLCAATQGSFWGWMIRPGDHGATVEDETTPGDIEEVSELDAFLDIAYSAIPDNIITAMSELSVLGIIVFFLCLGILLKDIQQDEKVIVLKFCRAVLKCTMKAIVGVVWFTPFGMLSLITAQIAYTPDLPGLLTSLGVFVATIIIALFGHVFIFYPILYCLTTRNSIFSGYKLLGQIHEAPLLAFATASSAATLPRSLLVAKKAGISKKVYQFIIPLGAAINMDGTATTFPIAIALIAQLHDIQLKMSVIVVITLLSVVVSIGTAPIPNAGMVYILMLLSAADLGEYEPEAMATLFVVEWFNDRLQTATNVTSDQFVAKICDDIQIKGDKENKNIYCGCCLGTRKRKRKTSISTIKEQEMV